MLRVHLLRQADGLRRQTPLQVRLEIQRKLRLRAVAFEDLLDRLNAGERAVDELGRDPALNGFGL